MCFVHFDICTIGGPVHTQTLIKLFPHYSQHIGCNESWNGRVGPPKSPDMKLLDFRDISKHCMYVDNIWNLLSLWEDCCYSRFCYIAGKNLVRVWLPFLCLQSYTNTRNIEVHQKHRKSFIMHPFTIYNQSCE